MNLKSLFKSRFFFITLFAFLSMLASFTAYAHVKWFVDTNTASVENFQPYTFTDTAVLVWIGVAFIIISISIFLDTKLPTMGIVDTKIRHDFIELLRIFTGMSFLLTAYEGAIVAPHLVAHGGLGMIFVLLQALIGIMLLGNRFIQYAGILIFILFLGVIIQFGFLSALEYFNIFGIGLFLFLNNLKTPELVEKYKPYSVDMLRICVGIALITLGITEKLTGAVYGQTFVADYQWNFMQALGFEMFTDRLFVLSAGISEIIIGIIVVLGTTTRLIVITVSVLMLTSNIVFIVQGHNLPARTEFVGHLPIIGSALVLILLGYGQRLKITNLMNKSKK